MVISCSYQRGFVAIKISTSHLLLMPIVKMRVHLALIMQQTGSDPFSKTFMSEFEKDRDYNLTVVFDTVAGRIVSDTYFFSKFFFLFHLGILVHNIMHIIHNIIALHSRSI